MAPRPYLNRDNAVILPQSDGLGRPPSGQSPPQRRQASSPWPSPYSLPGVARPRTSSPPGRRPNIHHLSLSAATYVLVLLVSTLGSAVFLSVAQALVNLVKSADTVQAFGRLLYIGLVMLGLFGASGELGGFWDTVSKWTPSER